MFTGLVAELGSVERLAEGEGTCCLSVRARKVLGGLKVGDSVAVNGVCLTVTDLRSNGFTADVMPETVGRTTMHGLRPGDRVNLERALRLADGLDGHIVQGHVEGVGTVTKVRPEGNALVYTIAAPAELTPYIVEKGSVTVDGVSLTVIQAGDTEFGVSLIPHTAAQTTLGYKKPGDTVNLETDILARYIGRFLSRRFGSPVGTAEDGSRKDDGLTMDFLRRNGF